VTHITEPWPWRAAFGVLVALWFALALLEIFVPASVLRWRRAWIDERRGRFGSQRVADFFDRLISSVELRVRLVGLVNLLLAWITASAFVFRR